MYKHRFNFLLVFNNEVICQLPAIQKIKSNSGNFFFEGRRAEILYLTLLLNFLIDHNIKINIISTFYLCKAFMQNSSNKLKIFLTFYKPFLIFFIFEFFFSILGDFGLRNAIGEGRSFRPHCQYCCSTFK